MTNPDANPPYKMATICQLTDFSPAVLRAWERRHKLLEPDRGQGGHRLYTSDDLRVLRKVKEMLGTGRTIGEAARIGRESLLGQPSNLGSASAAPQPIRIPILSGEAQDQIRQCRRQIVDAAMRLDGDEIERALEQAFARYSTETVIFEVMTRTAREIGDLWIAGKCSIANEHIASGIFVHRLLKLVESARPSYSPWPPVIVACFPDEYHQLGALGLSYLMTCSGVRVSYLGAALPLEDLEGGCEVLAPAAVLLSVTREAVYRLHRQQLLAILKRKKGDFVYCVGGQGAPRSDPEIQGAGAQIANPCGSLQDEIERILRVVRGSRGVPSLATSPG